MLRRTHIAVISVLALSAGVTLAQVGGGSLSTPGMPGDAPPANMGQNTQKQEIEARNVTLAEDLTVVIDGGNTIVLPAGTTIGRQEIESRITADNVTVRQETELRNVTLVADLTFTDPTTGQAVTLPTGTVLRLESEQRFDANGNPVRNEFKLVAVQPDGTVVRIRDRVPENNQRQETEARNVTLAEDLTVVIDGGNTIVLPAGTTIGRQEIKSRVNGNSQTVRQETKLRDVTLVADLTFTDPTTGQDVTLPAGTVLRLESKQRLDAGGNVVRSEFRLRALQPDGTVVRIRDRTPRVDVAEMDDDAGVSGSSSRRGGEGNGSMSANSGRSANSGPGSANSGRGENSGPGSANSGRGENSGPGSANSGRSANRGPGGGRELSGRSGPERTSIDRSGPGERAGSSAMDRPVTAESVSRVERPQRVERPEVARVERAERVDRVERPERVERAEIARVERVDRPVRVERVERSGSNSGRH